MRELIRLEFFQMDEYELDDSMADYSGLSLGYEVNRTLICSSKVLGSIILQSTLPEESHVF